MQIIKPHIEAFWKQIQALNMYLRLAKGRADENSATDEQSDDVVDDQTTRPIIQILSPFPRFSRDPKDVDHF